MGIRDRPTAPASPWQNGFAERLIGSIRRECVDHFVVLSEAHLHVSVRRLGQMDDPDDFLGSGAKFGVDALDHNVVSRQVQRTISINRAAEYLYTSTISARVLSIKSRTS
jgi:hypothetical protein